MPHIEQLQQAAQRDDASQGLRDFNNRITDLVAAHASGTMTFAQYQEANIELTEDALAARDNGVLRHEFEYLMVVNAAGEQFNEIARQQRRTVANPGNDPQATGPLATGNRLAARRGLNLNIPLLPDNLPNVEPTGLTPTTPAPGAHPHNPFFPPAPVQAHVQDQAPRRR